MDLELRLPSPDRTQQPVAALSYRRLAVSGPLGQSSVRIGVFQRSIEEGRGPKNEPDW